MPADIRSFFGGKTQKSVVGKEAKNGGETKRRANKGRKVIEDSDNDDEDIPQKTPTPKKVAAKKVMKRESPTVQETTTDDYFASNSKPRSIKSTPSRTRLSTGTRSSARKKKATVSYNEYGVDDLNLPDHGDDAADDIFVAKLTERNDRKKAYVEVSSDDEELTQSAKLIRTPVASSPRKRDVEMRDFSDDQSPIMVGKSRRIIPEEKDASRQVNRKRKSVDLDSSEDNEAGNSTIKSVKSIKAQSSKPPPAKRPRAPKKDETENTAVKAILDSISTVRPPTPPPKDPDAKWNWRQGGGGANSVPPSAAGSKEVPVGQDNCLTGMSFVFTGLLESLSRDEGMELVKRYGGKCTGAPSSKTTFVVLGSDAGPSKLRKIQELSIKTINEDGLFELISRLPANGGDGKAAEANLEKKRKELEKIQRDAEEMEADERRKIKEAEEISRNAQKLATAKDSSAALGMIRRPTPTSSQLWTSKYAPMSVNQICGNKSAVEKIQAWLKGWPAAHRYNFQKRGPEGLGGYRAIIIHGPPGIGKTTAAHLAAKLAGYDVLESNASDTRSKKLVESGLSEVLNNNSLCGYFASGGRDIDEHKKKIVLIMDEVDGMSAGDRGGVGALAKICKKTDIPMILICNERRLPKMKPFDHVTVDIPFRRPTVDQIRSRIATICHREGLKLPTNVIDALIEGSNKDIRQIINMISTAKLDQAAMDFDQGKSMSKAWEKHVVLKPWDICHKLLGGGMFAPSSKSTLNDKIELYFNDHEFSYLMIQENYLGTKPILLGSLTGREARLKALQLADEAAESISDGDLVDRMIHGSQQQWSLMPTHAVFSAVRPASFTSGLMTGQTNFTQWLGNNSKLGKLSRYLKEIQSHMRLRTSGDRHEVRQQYLPVLWAQTIRRLETEGKDGVDGVIDLMDSYFLTKDDYDYITELGLGPQNMEDIHLESQTKAAFTRIYNQRSHPLPFMKAGSAVVPTKAKRDVPDLEEAFEEEDDDGELAADVKDGIEDELDLKKDKYIKQPKAKKAEASKSSRSKAIDDQDVEDRARGQEMNTEKKRRSKVNNTSKRGPKSIK